MFRWLAPAEQKNKEYGIWEWEYNSLGASQSTYISTQQTLNRLDHGKKLLGIFIAEVPNKDQVIATLLKRTLSNIVITHFIPNASLLETLCNVGGNRDGSTSYLRYQTVFLAWREFF